MAAQGKSLAEIQSVAQKNDKDKDIKKVQDKYFGDESKAEEQILTEEEKEEKIAKEKQKQEVEEAKRLAEVAKEKQKENNKYLMASLSISEIEESPQKYTTPEPEKPKAAVETKKVLKKVELPKPKPVAVPEPQPVEAAAQVVAAPAAPTAPEPIPEPVIAPVAIAPKSLAQKSQKEYELDQKVNQ